MITVLEKLCDIAKEQGSQRGVVFILVAFLSLKFIREVDKSLRQLHCSEHLWKQAGRAIYRLFVRAANALDNLTGSRKSQSPRPVSNAIFLIIDALFYWTLSAYATALAIVTALLPISKGVHGLLHTFGTGLLAFALFIFAAAYRNFGLRAFARVVAQRK